MFKVRSEDMAIIFISLSWNDSRILHVTLICLRSRAKYVC